MKVLAIVGGAILSIIMVGVFIVMYVMGVYNQGNTYEKALIAERDNNRNILSNYGKKVVEAAQIPEMQRDDVMKIVKATMEGRYGSDGSKASMQWIKENNIQIDSAVYARLQRLIESGRNEFSAGQTKLISVKQEYTKILDSVPRGFVMRFVGYPKIDLTQFDIVSDDRTETAFKTLKEEAIQIRK